MVYSPAMKRRTERRNVLLTCDSDYSSGRRVISGALRRMADMPDWDVTTLNHHNQGFRQSVRLLTKKRPFDGVISDSDAPWAEGLGKAMPRAVFVNATVPAPDWTRYGCMADNREVAEAAAATLLRLEPRHFAYVGARAHDLENFHSTARERFFRRVLEAKGRKVTTLFGDDPDLPRLIEALPKPVGIFAYNDVTAARVLSECRALGVSVPEQAAVIGVDNDPDICENTRPRLSSVDMDFEAAGRLATEVLSAALNGHTRLPRRTFGVRGIVERESTQEARTGSRIVAAARETLRRHYAEKLSLGQIARRLNISPRLLSLRFREITGHTVHDELEDLRLTAARRMLESRDGPVKSVAAACGFPSLENFYRRYRRRYGTTPRSTKFHIAK